MAPVSDPDADRAVKMVRAAKIHRILTPSPRAIFLTNPSLPTTLAQVLNGMDVCAVCDACGLAASQRQNIRKRVRKQREDDDARAKADAEVKIVRELATELTSGAAARPLYLA